MKPTLNVTQSRRQRADRVAEADRAGEVAAEGGEAQDDPLDARLRSLDRLVDQRVGLGELDAAREGDVGLLRALSLRL